MYYSQHLCLVLFLKKESKTKLAHPSFDVRTLTDAPTKLLIMPPLKKPEENHHLLVFPAEENDDALLELKQALGGTCGISKTRPLIRSVISFKRHNTNWVSWSPPSNLLTGPLHCMIPKSRIYKSEKSVIEVKRYWFKNIYRLIVNSM